MDSFPRAPAIKGSLLSAGVLVRNSGGGIAVQKARNERNPSKKVLNPSNIERGNRGGLVQFSYSIGLHCACQMQAQIPKGAEEDQVEWNVVRTTTIGIRGCPKWANCTMEEKLWADYPHAVWIRQGIFNNVAIITIPNVKWIRRDGCQ